MKKLLLLAFLFALTPAAWSQGFSIYGQAITTQGIPAANATVRVCPTSSTGYPCSPTATLYSDAGLTTTIPNPTQTDANGNYNFFVNPGAATYFLLQIGIPGGQTYQYIVTASTGGGGGIGPVFNIGDFGGKCDGHTLDDPALQATNAAVNAWAAVQPFPQTLTPVITTPLTQQSCMLGTNTNVASSTMINTTGGSGFQAAPALGAANALTYYQNSAIPDIRGGFIGVLNGYGNLTTGALIEATKMTNGYFDVNMAEHGGIGLVINNAERMTIHYLMNGMRQCMVDYAGSNEQWIDEICQFPGYNDVVTGPLGTSVATDYSINAINGVFPAANTGPTTPSCEVLPCPTPIVPNNQYAAVVFDGPEIVHVTGHGTVKSGSPPFGDLPKLKVTGGSRVDYDSGYFELTGYSPSVMVGGGLVYSQLQAAFSSTAFNVPIDTASYAWQTEQVNLCSNAVANYNPSAYVWFAADDYVPNSTQPSVMGGGILKGSFEYAFLGNFCGGATPMLYTGVSTSNNGRGALSTTALNWPAPTYDGQGVLHHVVVAEFSPTISPSVRFTHTHFVGIGNAFATAGYAVNLDFSTIRTAAEIIVGYIPDGFAVQPTSSGNPKAVLDLDFANMVYDGTTGGTANPETGLIWVHTGGKIDLHGMTGGTLSPFSTNNGSHCVGYFTGGYYYGNSSICAAQYVGGTQAQMDITDNDNGRHINNLSKIATQEIAPIDPSTLLSVPGESCLGECALQYWPAYGTPQSVLTVSTTGGSIPAGNWAFTQAYVYATAFGVGGYTATYLNWTPPTASTGFTGGGRVSARGVGPYDPSTGLGPNDSVITAIACTAPNSVTVTATNSYSTGNLTTLSGATLTTCGLSSNSLTGRVTAASGSSFTMTLLNGNMSVGNQTSATETGRATISQCPEWSTVAVNNTAGTIVAIGGTSAAFPGYCTVAPGTSVLTDISDAPGEPQGTVTNTPTPSSLIVQGTYGHYNKQQVIPFTGSTSSAVIASPPTDTNGLATYWNCDAGPPGIMTYAIQHNIPIGTPCIIGTDAPSGVATLNPAPTSANGYSITPQDAGYNLLPAARVVGQNSIANSGGSFNFSVDTWIQQSQTWNPIFAANSSGGVVTYAPANPGVPNIGCLQQLSGGGITGTGSPCGSGGGGGGGTVTSFSAGNLSPLFTTSVGTATSTPALSFSLNSQTANTIFGAISTTPSWLTVPNCSSLIGWLNGTGFTCGTQVGKIFMVDQFPSGGGAWQGALNTGTTSYPACSAGSATTTITISNTALVSGTTYTFTYTGQQVMMGANVVLSVSGMTSQTVIASPTLLSSTSFQATVTGSVTAGGSGTASITTNYITGVTSTVSHTPTTSFPYTEWKPLWNVSTAGGTTLASSVTPTQIDCAFAAAQNFADTEGAGGTSPVIWATQGVYNTATGFPISPQAGGWPLVSIWGSGQNTTIIHQTSPISVGSIFVNNSPTSGAGGAEYKGFSLYGQGNSPMGIQDWGGGATPESFVFADLYLTGFIGSGTGSAFLQIGNPTNPTGFVGQMAGARFDNVYAAGNGFSHGNNATISTPTVTSGQISITVTAGGSYHNSTPPLYVVGFGDGSTPCSTNPTITLPTTLVSGHYTVTPGTYNLSTLGFSSDCTLGNGIYVYMPDYPNAQYAFDFNNLTDSTIVGLKASGVGYIAAVRAGAANDQFLSMHVWNSYTGIFTSGGSDGLKVTQYNCDSNLIDFHVSKPSTMSGCRPYFNPTTPNLFAGAIQYLIESTATGSYLGPDMSEPSEAVNNDFQPFVRGGTGAGTGPIPISLFGTGTGYSGVLPANITLVWQGQTYASTMQVAVETLGSAVTTSQVPLIISAPNLATNNSVQAQIGIGATYGNITFNNNSVSPFFGIGWGSTPTLHTSAAGSWQVDVNLDANAGLNASTTGVNAATFSSTVTTGGNLVLDLCPLLATSSYCAHGFGISTSADATLGYYNNAGVGMGYLSLNGQNPALGTGVALEWNTAGMVTAPVSIAVPVIYPGPAGLFSFTTKQACNAAAINAKIDISDAPAPTAGTFPQVYASGMGVWSGQAICLFNGVSTYTWYVVN